MRFFGAVMFRGKGLEFLHSCLVRMNPARLVFCGGGTRCLIFMQALIALERAQRLTRVKEYWGTSAGALLAGLLAVGKSPARIKSVMWGADYTKFRNMDVGNMLGIMSSWGLDDGASLTGEIERLFEVMEPGSKNRKLRDISGLNIVVSDLNIHDTVVINSESFPELRVVDAIRASMSLPIFFRPFISPANGHYWVDGAVRAHFPWHILPSDDARREALGFSFEKSWEGGPKSFTEYLFSMIHFDEPRTIRNLKTKWPHNIIWFPTPPYPAWFVRIREEDFALIETIGQAAYDKWITALGDSQYPQGSYGTQTVSGRPHTPSTSSPVHHTAELLGSPQVSQAPSLSPSPPQLPHKLPSRRWTI